MTATHKDAAGQALCETLSRIAFIFADPQDPDAPPTEPQSSLKARLSFKGSVQGTLEMALPAPLGTEIAANMLGCEPDDEEAAKASIDSVKEVLNVMCGQILPQLYGEHTLFDLTAPEVEEINLTDWCDLQRDEQTARFQIEEQPVLVRMCLAS